MATGLWRGGVSGHTWSIIALEVGNKTCSAYKCILVSGIASI